MSSPTLWIQLAEEASLPHQLTASEKSRLLDLFNFHDHASAWCRAALALDLPLNAPLTDLVRWHEGTPYVNWSGMVGIVTCGWMETLPTPEGGYEYRSKARLTRLPTLLKSQWRIEQYLNSRLTPGRLLPTAREDQIVESLALGLCILALLIRLPRHTPAQLAQWLSSPQSAPGSRVAGLVRKLDAIQRRRTLLSTA